MGYYKYNSIENSYREKFLEFVRNTSAANDVWFVTEKIHGSNFTISYHNGFLKFGKRGSELETNENFYNYNSIFTKEVQEKIIKAFEPMDFSTAKNSKITYYGEIFGPGVQKGVNYGEKGFRFFDVLLEINNEIIFSEQTNLKNFEIENILLMAPYIGQGTLDEVLDFNCEFDSKILNIPNNPAEGIVLKPNKACFLEGSGDRIILKKKHPKFSEIAKEVKPDKQKQGLSENIVKYITENRLDNVFSKIEPSFKNFNQIKEEFIKDVLDELKKDDIMDDISMLDKECSNFIREIIKRKI